MLMNFIVSVPETFLFKKNLPLANQPGYRKQRFNENFKYHKAANRTRHLGTMLRNIILLLFIYLLTR